MTNLPIPVILFRTLTQPFASDPFHLLLAQGPYEEKSIPVLNETYVVEELTRIVERGPDGWEGVIIMSRRGAEGWVQATKLFNDARGDYDPSGFEGDHPEVTEEGREELENGGGKFESPSEPSESFKSTHRTPDWSITPLFTVGSSARDTLIHASLPAHLKPSTFNTSLTAKSAAALVPILLTHPPLASSYKSYLILRGDKSLDEIPTALARAGREVREVTVYETKADPNLARRVSVISEELRGYETVWMAFFSPSSASMVLPHLRRFGLLDGTRFRAGLDIRVAAIGETTRHFLKDEGVEVIAVAQHPSAEGLVNAIKTADRAVPNAIV